MIEKILEIVQTGLADLDIPYEFMRYNAEVIDRYWVGEYSETPTVNEDGYCEATILLTGTTKQAWMTLLQDREKIENHFPRIGGLRVATDKGTVVIMYDNSTPIPTGDADLKRIQINLHIKAWKGMI